jgi:predicted nuclease with TOPRIM domain
MGPPSCIWDHDLAFMSLAKLNKILVNSKLILVCSLKERNSLLEELLRRREDYGEVSNDLQVIEAERVRLSLLEEKIKEVLTMLRSLNSMVIK